MIIPISQMRKQASQLPQLINATKLSQDLESSKRETKLFSVIL